ncbi:hypothetical protein ASF58_08145 [Methylobacterium sp. Leaf125]|uniref:hypothetical protein n=1 Tax=Methylobacterium sp. Leaf125 TaxID=1736265 RepID=UPI0006F87261|nr:hypothetical protein [Methylobacterium sp. Leaf125]KQQ40916.1 hypothetical protein ASF58_08145 [Methylobacterium sp. Leaf125]
MRSIPTTRTRVCASSLRVAGVLAGAPALAQGNAPAEIKQPGLPRMTAPGLAGAAVVKLGGLDKGGPGAIGTVAPGATGASCAANTSRASGSAGQN